MNLQEKLRKAHVYSLCVTFVTVGISVSISQGFLVLSFLFGIFSWKLSKDNRPFFPRSWLFYLAISLFIWYFLDFILHSFLPGDSSELKRAWNGELKDSFLFLGFLSVWMVRSEDIPKLFQSLFVLFLVLVFTGILGGFTSVRLSRWISELYTSSSTYRFTHPLGSFGGIPLYISIGLMNTHLTFGGLLQFFSGFIVFKFLKSLYRAEKKEIFAYATLLVLYMFVFLLNQARSAMIGALVTLTLAGIHLFFVKKELPKNYLIKGGLIFTISALVLGLGLAFSPAGKKVLGPIFGKEKHTDSGRTFIWDSTFPLIGEHPWIGVGPGNYNKEIQKTRTQHSEDYPELAYFYEVTQRGHAHNDYFHFFAVFGFPAILLYLLLSGNIISRLFESRLIFDRLIYFYGLLGFFASGLFQCYFQDDEVVILFWLLLGLFVRSENDSAQQSEVTSH
ncbi:ligase [Leptospira perolatii]|uniref:Ligase n=1 Tax=Leptospira perolatii TaxID=2023191 RepID=A0A2M9ZJN6_9LEPT|nr:O-antigen ligase family protein [Leptospira perolatii]PJZ69443.1 ligase [Leptospira perolatii]PJZ72268.1 ligase [Leptospira perolatii]